MRCTALLCCLALAAACGRAAASQAAPASGAHERACTTAFGVLQHCAASGSAQGTVPARCCGLLAIFRRNGCLCPDCPHGASADTTSLQGELLSEELSPLLELCSAAVELEQPHERQGQDEAGGELEQPAAESQVSKEAEADEGEEEEAYDEDSAMADMAGRAAWAQDPRSRHLPASTASAAAATTIEARLEQLEERARLMDTPVDDYDNQLSDGDAAFMLVDPAEAARYARRAAELAARLAADLAADVNQGRSAAARIGATVQARVAQLLAGSGSVAVDGFVGGEADAAAEATASAAAVSDDSVDDGGDDVLRGGAAARLRLADPSRVPATPEQRRAVALAAAMERQQARHLARRAAQRAAGGSQVSAAAEQQQEQQQQQRVQLDLGRDEGGEGTPGKRLSVDITVDADTPEAARRMAHNIASLLRTWQAASGSASSQAQLAAALEAAAAGVAAAAARGGPLGRAGLQLQPRRLEVQQLEEGEARTCACLGTDTSALNEPATDLPMMVYQRYLAARLSLCRFACQHEHALAVLLIAELGLCVAWLAVWLLRHSAREVGSAAEGGEGSGDGQFLIAAASDPQWRRDRSLAQPLLGRSSRSSSLSSISSC